MPEPRTKAVIIKRLHTERRRLEASLATLTPEQMLRPNAVGKYSIKDVLGKTKIRKWIKASKDA